MEGKYKVLVTGGLGFIGSHAVVSLIDSGFEVCIIDNLMNSKIDVLKGILKISGVMPQFDRIDLRDKKQVNDYFTRNSDIRGVIHFAASKAVGESVENPLLYYENNINTLVYLLEAMSNNGISNLIFSSSCTVYGNASSLPIMENAPIQVANSPYGNTKQIGEEIIADVTRSSTLRAILLRYFNPIGAHPSGLIGELPLGVPQNLVPYITQTAMGLRDELRVFGADYDTPDGTGVRDYIHVMDLAEAHVLALQRLLNSDDDLQLDVFNLGTGKGTSVLELIHTFENITGIDVPYRIVDRRSGDVTAAYADVNKANTVLGWKHKRSLDAALRDAWLWEINCQKNKGITNV